MQLDLDIEGWRIEFELRYGVYICDGSDDIEW